MARKTKKRQTALLAHKHTGKLRPHRHTSYGALMVVLLLAFAPLLFVSRSAAADGASPGDGNDQLSAVVAAPVPKTAPVISSPTTGQVFKSTQPVTVQGSCPNKTLVQIFKNQVMSGAELCSGGAFAIATDLFAGTNSLIARAYNANNISGPDSTPVSVVSSPNGVNLQGTGELNALGEPANQFYVTAQVYYRGVEAGSNTAWTLSVSGGQAPYAVNIGWGDGKSDLISRTAAGSFTVNHDYAHASSSGHYMIVIRATDANGNASYLQLVAIVSGNAATGIGKIIGGGYDSSTAIRFAWQLLVLAVFAVASFWIGEKRGARLLTKSGRAA